MRDLLGRIPLPEGERARDALGAAAAAAAIIALFLADGDADALATLDFAATMVACVALVWRRRVPLAVLGAVLALYIVVTAVDGALSTVFVVLIVALYTSTSRAGTVPRALAIGVVATAVAAGTLALATASSSDQLVSAAAWGGLASAIGLAMLLYRRGVAKERERALRAEEARDATAQRRVAEERLRIARELHDAVGHHVAVITVQAGLAEHLLDTRPAAAAAALTRVQEAGARVLEELPVMLRVLRQDDEERDDAPAQGVADVPTLVDQTRDGGLEVDLRSEAAPDLSAAADLAAYRIVQEALTNARRYGTGAATVSLAVRDGALAIEVRNAVDPSREPGAGSGFGLVGMRERAAAAEGDVTAERIGDEFVVRAVLPVRDASPTRKDGAS
ncbi:histidine kinase [Demequina sp. SYSU T00192]|uniref:histidine kinase n=1 Tax=Demequina litoralis TaxID=3051660 RepID=A0ABT8G7M8_9MICO|nr:histidine kinase [Demequina sp. SYSU T00192]MDN4475133.1 histidine kinase [Demequina sp. SYSU T00192]